MASAHEVYTQRAVDRQQYLDEAYTSAKLTIPSVIPDAQDIRERTPNQRLKKPFQSLGARGVNNLSAKMLMALFPSNSSFFRYMPAEEVKDAAGEAGDGDLTKIQSLLSRRESRINTEIELQGVRPKIYQAVRHLLIAGNVLLYKKPKKGIQVFPLNSYVVKRDGTGRLLDLIYLEQMDRESITDPKVLAALAQEDPTAGQKPDTKDAERKTVDLWTRVVLEPGGKYRSWQEVGKVKIEDTEETWKPELLPWLVLRYTSIDGEDYGRGFVEEYRGDLTSYEQLSRDVQFASANAAKVVWRINPSSVLKPKKFIEAPNGGAVLGAKDDVEALRLDKGGDMQVAVLTQDRLEKSLSASFLLGSSFQRNGERVTAEEIRRLAQELEDTLGGTFSLFSQELQLPLALLLEAEMIRTKDGFEALPKDSVRVAVVTGLAAIGRNQELERFVTALNLMAQAAQVLPGLPDHVEEAEASRRIWQGSGVETDGLIKSIEKVNAERQAQQQQQANTILGTELAKGAGRATGNVPPENIASAIKQQAQAS